MNAATSTYAWNIFNTFAWVFLLLSNLFFCLHLLLMWAGFGRHTDHPTLIIEKHGSAPHGAEGRIQNQ